MAIHIGFEVPGATVRQKKLFTMVMATTEKKKFRTSFTKNEFGSMATYERPIPEKQIIAKVVVTRHLAIGKRVVDVRRRGRVLFEATYWYPAFDKNREQGRRMIVSAHSLGDWEKLFTGGAAQ